MSRNQTNIQRSVKDILVSHEERIQTILKQVGKGNIVNNVSIENMEKKQYQLDELSKKMMMNQRTFNNSLQLLNGRLSKVEQLLVEVSLDIRNLKKRVLSENNIHLDISEKTSNLVNEVAEAPKEVKVEEEPIKDTSEKVVETSDEINKEIATKAASVAASVVVASEVATKVNNEPSSKDATVEKDDVKEEVKEEIKKTKKEKKGDLSVVIDENKNEEFN